MKKLQHFPPQVKNDTLKGNNLSGPSPMRVHLLHTLSRHYLLCIVHSPYSSREGQPGKRNARMDIGKELFFSLCEMRGFAFLSNIFLSIFGELWNSTDNDNYLMRVTKSFTQHSLNISHHCYLLLCCQRMGYLAWCWSCLRLTFIKFSSFKNKTSHNGWRHSGLK